MSTLARFSLNLTIPIIQLLLFVEKRSLPDAASHFPQCSAPIPPPSSPSSNSPDASPQLENLPPNFRRARHAQTVCLPLLLLHAQLSPGPTPHALAAPRVPLLRFNKHPPLKPMRVRLAPHPTPVLRVDVAPQSRLFDDLSRIGVAATRPGAHDRAIPRPRRHLDRSPPRSPRTAAGRARRRGLRVQCSSSNSPVVLCLENFSHSDLGGRLNPHVSPQWHLRAEQTTAEQTDLALVPRQWTETLRLCPAAGWDEGMGIFEGRKFAVEVIERGVES